MTDIMELTPYMEAGWQLIPLHKFDYKDKHKGRTRERGKSPFHNNWTTRVYDNKEMPKHLMSGSNVGVRLRPEDLVIDVDPRNFDPGDDPIARLCADCGMDPNEYPTVETGSGGLHLYMRKPMDVSVRDTLEDYAGVEFKTRGRQVVAAGSTHPNGMQYCWDFLRPSIAEAPNAPTRLLNLIRRPLGSTASGGGEHTQEEIACMLDTLDPEDFREHDAWLTLMQACHHASGGDARSEFVEWCTRDPQYVDDGGVVGRRWDSLHADVKGARITYKTLHKLLIDAGQEAVIPRAPAEDDFETVGTDDMPQDDTPEHEQKGPLERTNDKFCAVMEGGQFRVFWEEEDPATGDPDHGIPPRTAWIRAKIGDFKLMLANKKVQKGEGAVPLADAWVEWAGRRSARGVVFDPECDYEGFLNLWTGWGFDPRKGGSWSMLDELLHDVLCDRDEAVYEYVLNWAAHMIQHPGSPAEVAICFQGGRGVGKGTWGRTLVRLAGQHGMQITSSEHLTGRFNDHLRDCILLFADEALKPYDKDGESRLKGLITEPSLAFEGKGRDVKTDKNRLHIVMASNEDWFVPMSLHGERRFLLQKANNERQNQSGWFQKLNSQLNSGGYEALLWDLLHRDIKGWSPRNHIPTTSAAVEQKIRNMGPVEQWWFNILQEGELPFEPAGEDTDWSMDYVRVFRQEVKASFAEHCKSNGLPKIGNMGRSVDMMFAGEMRRLIPGLSNRIRIMVPMERYGVSSHSDGRAWAYELPPLTTCRAAMTELLGNKVNWGNNRD